MRWTPLLAVPLLSLAPQAQQQVTDEPVITVHGQSFMTWQDYTSSPLFRQLGLRCMTQEPGDLGELRPQSDCSSSSTTIRPEYAPPGQLYRIPVVFHVLRTDSGSGNVTDALINSQIDILNEDFHALAGTPGAPGTDANIEFFLAVQDPQGNPTTGINRYNNTTWHNDGGSYYNTLAWDTTRYLNIYTNTASGALGYVPSLPANGIVGSDADRVVILWSAVGRNAPIGHPFDQGRTATHEVGHYLGLYHTFNAGCDSGSCYTSGDRICDTQNENGPVFGCPPSSTSCGNADPFHNYMDYADDPCMNNFTPEQVNRMRCTLDNWRVDLPDDSTCGTPASNFSRSGGLNLPVYSATPAVMGGTSQVTINSGTAHTFAVIKAFSAPQSAMLPSGYVRLFNPTSAFYFKVNVALPAIGVNFNIPNDPFLCGLTAYSQAILSGGGAGIAWSNSVDMTAGF